jgi:hypothetical protein
MSDEAAKARQEEARASGDGTRLPRNGEKWPPPIAVEIVERGLVANVADRSRRKRSRVPAKADGNIWFGRPQSFAAQLSGHLIARSSTDCGISMPSFSAVLRLMTRSKLVGCSIGRWAGIAPLRIEPIRNFVCEAYHGD